MFPENDELEENIEIMPNDNLGNINDEIFWGPTSNIDSYDDYDERDSDHNTDQELKDEGDYLTKQPVRNYQFTYNKSLWMANKYPDIDAVDPTKDDEVAPGEGKRPNDMMREKDLYFKASPPPSPL